MDVRERKDVSELEHRGKLSKASLGVRPGLLPGAPGPWSRPPRSQKSQLRDSREGQGHLRRGSSGQLHLKT